MSGDRYFIHDQNALYFLTFTAVNWLDAFYPYITHVPVLSFHLSRYLLLIQSRRENLKIWGRKKEEQT
jgi:hypothetical protein